MKLIKKFSDRHSTYKISNGRYFEVYDIDNNTRRVVFTLRDGSSINIDEMTWQNFSIKGKPLTLTIRLWV